jgi:hypothetical protein
MSKIELHADEGSTKPHHSPREPWVTPVIVKINAGSAENGFTQNNPDGQFTKS